MFLFFKESRKDLAIARAQPADFYISVILMNVYTHM